MANGQFIIPGTPENEEIRHTPVTVAEATIAAPELEKGEYSKIVGMQLDIEMERSFACQEVVGGSFLRRTLKSLVSTPRPSEAQLIDEESIIGGKLFSHEGAESDGRRFWYLEGDWFFEQPDESKKYKVIRYQIFENSIHKIVKGIEYPFAEGEKDTLLIAIERYHAAVMEQLYNASSQPGLAA